MYKRPDDLSTETEAVGVDDLMPAILWTRMFLEAQGYSVTENVIFQDNQSAILLEKNRKASSGKRTCLLHTSDAADEEDCVARGGRGVSHHTHRQSYQP